MIYIIMFLVVLMMCIADIITGIIKGTFDGWLLQHDYARRTAAQSTGASDNGVRDWLTNWAELHRKILRL